MLDQGYHWDLSDEEAQELGRRSIYAAGHRDAFSGNTCNLYHVKEDGWKFIGLWYLDYFGCLAYLLYLQETTMYPRCITKVLEMSQVLLVVGMDTTCELRAVARLTHLLSLLPHKSRHELYMYYTNAIPFFSTITSIFFCVFKLLKDAPSLSNRPWRVYFNDSMRSGYFPLSFPTVWYRGSFAKSLSCQFGFQLCFVMVHYHSFFLKESHRLQWLPLRKRKAQGN